jgi:MFS family permease
MTCSTGTTFADHKARRNRHIYLFSSACDGLAYGLWLGAMITVLLFELSNGSNLKVGYVDGASGLTELLCAIPAGILADRGRRSRIIRVAAFISIAAAAMSVYVTYEAKDGSGRNVYLYLGCLIGVGVGSGMEASASAALFADSTEKSTRSLWETRSRILFLVAEAIGPVAAAIMFWGRDED